jgi:hypothetical protein
VQRTTARPQQGALTETLNLSGLPTGVYSVRIHAQEGTVVKRLVKE